MKVYGECVIPWKQTDTVRGFQQWQDRCWPGHQVCTQQMICGVQTHSAADVARELDIHWVVHRIVCDQLDYREMYIHWVPKMTKLNVWDCMGLVSIWHVTLIKEGSFRAKTWLITQNLKPERGSVIEKLLSSSSKENGRNVIGKDDHGKLSRDHKHVLVLDFLDHGDIVGWVLFWHT